MPPSQPLSYLFDSPVCYIPENTTTIAPLTPYDKWDGEKWVTDTEAQHNAAVEAAEAQRQSLIDAQPQMRTAHVTLPLIIL